MFRLVCSFKYNFVQILASLIISCVEVFVAVKRLQSVIVKDEVININFDRMLIDCIWFEP